MKQIPTPDATVIEGGFMQMPIESYRGGVYAAVISYENTDAENEYTLHLHGAEEMDEDALIDVLSHETMHIVLEELIGEEASIGLDSIVTADSLLHME